MDNFNKRYLNDNNKNTKIPYNSYELSFYK